MTTDIVSELSVRFPPEAVITQHEDLLAYSYDGTPILQQLPRAVVLVNSHADVVTVLTLAAKYGTPVVTRGSGTGLSGGSIPVEGSIVLCTARMNRVLRRASSTRNFLKLRWPWSKSRRFWTIRRAIGPGDCRSKAYLQDLGCFG
jgi:glycolate oxidase